MMWIVLAQIIPPSPDQNPWAWIAFIMALALGYLGTDVIGQRNYWRDEARKSSDALAANTPVMSKLTDTVDKSNLMASDNARAIADAGTRVASSMEKIEEGLRRNEERLRRIEADVAGQSVARKRTP